MGHAEVGEDEPAQNLDGAFFRSVGSRPEATGQIGIEAVLG